MVTTFSEAVDAYLENADFEESRSLSKARAFVTACVRLAVLLPASASDQGSAQSFNTADIQANKERAQTFIAANARGSSARFLSVNTGDFR